jgi:steroid delta-isomerase-like uncharacterized protein
MTSTERSKAVVERLHQEVFVNENMEVVDEVVSPDYVGHHVDRDVGREQEFKQHLPAYREAFPDLEFTFDETIAEGDTVAGRFSISGTHENQFMGIPPTGKRFEISGQIFHRIEDGKIIESWPLRDDLGMMQQIGVVSMPEPEMA